MNLKKRFANYIILTILCLVFAAVLVSCSRDGVKSLSVSGPEEIKVGDFDYSDFTVDVVYESGGTKKIALDKSMLSNEDNLKFFESGKQTLTVNYDGATCEFSLNVCLYEFADLRFDDVNEVYTGKSITAEVYDNYPEGTNVYYVNGNSFVDAGTYEVTAIVSRKNYVTETLTATVNISKAKYDMSGISFQDKTVEYDGKEHSVAITGILPEGVSVRYEDGADWYSSIR